MATRQVDRASRKQVHSGPQTNPAVAMRVGRWVQGRAATRAAGPARAAVASVVAALLCVFGPVMKKGMVGEGVGMTMEAGVGAGEAHTDTQTHTHTHMHTRGTVRQRAAKEAAVGKVTECVFLCVSVEGVGEEAHKPSVRVAQAHAADLRHAEAQPAAAAAAARARAGPASCAAAAAAVGGVVAAGRLLAALCTIILV